jgi:two-component system, sensor histidine kinase PdtaS
MERVRKLLRWSCGLSRFERLLGATLVVGIITLIQLLLDPFMGGHIYILFVLAVAICASVFQHMTGFYALVLSSLAVSYLFNEPRFTLGMSVTDVVSLAVFVVTSIIIIAICEIVWMLAHSLNKADDEKAMLLRELNHRIRNNLQLISASVHLSTFDEKNSALKDRLETVAQRIDTIGYIGQALSSDKSGVSDARKYFDGLIGDISASTIGARPIAVTHRIQAVPIKRAAAETLGIAINELITNAVKYAFPYGRSGKIEIDFTHKPAGVYSLTVADDGVGCLPGFTKGAGLEMVSTLVGIYGGSVEIQDTAPGCKVTVLMQVNGR